MSHWNLLITTVRFIKTITFNIGLILGGGGQFVEEASPPSHPSK